VLAGFRFVRRDRVLRLLALSFMVFIVGMATTLVADPVLADEFGTGSLGFGLITALWGAGTIVGVWLGRRITEETEGRWMVGCSVLVALTGFGVALSPWFGLVLFWMFAFGATDGPTQVVEQNLLQRRSPDVVRSRVMGAWETLMHGSLVVALVAGGWIVSALGPRGAYAIGGMTGLVGAVLLLPFLRWLPEPKTDVGVVKELDAVKRCRSTPSTRRGATGSDCPHARGSTEGAGGVPFGLRPRLVPARRGERLPRPDPLTGSQAAPVVSATIGSGTVSVIVPFDAHVILTERAGAGVVHAGRSVSDTGLEVDVARAAGRPRSAGS
jgi:MFS family permease